MYPQKSLNGDDFNISHVGVGKNGDFVAHFMERSNFFQTADVGTIIGKEHCGGQGQDIEFFLGGILFAQNGTASSSVRLYFRQAGKTNHFILIIFALWAFTEAAKTDQLIEQTGGFNFGRDQFRVKEIALFKISQPFYTSYQGLTSLLGQFS